MPIFFSAMRIFDISNWTE